MTVILQKVVEVRMSGPGGEALARGIFSFMEREEVMVVCNGRSVGS